MQWPLPALYLVLVLDQFIWMRLNAVAVKVICLNAHGTLVSAVTRPIDIGGTTTTGDITSVHMEVLE